VRRLIEEDPMFDDHYAYPEMVYVAAAERVHAMQRAEAAERARRARRARRVQRVRASLRSVTRFGGR
jgi:hypothetical protein